jgi:hypothetical protein
MGVENGFFHTVSKLIANLTIFPETVKPVRFRNSRIIDSNLRQAGGL